LDVVLEQSKEEEQEEAGSLLEDRSASVKIGVESDD
jgi:hypothetical protein